MSSRRLNKKGRNNKSRFVMLRYDIMDSPAYGALSTVERCVYLAIKRRFNGHNNGEIPLSCREAAELCNVSKNTASSAFRGIQEKGFVSVTVEAGFNQKGGRRSRRWRLTEEPFNGHPPTSDWRNWRPETDQ